MPQFSLRLFGDPDPDADFELLRRLSNYQVPQDPKGNEEWLQNRRTFDESTRQRRHYIALAKDEPVGYASIEQERGSADRYRMYLVFDPKRWGYEELGDFMYQRLLNEAKDLNAQTLVFIEYASDQGFFHFLERRGFLEVGLSDFNGFEIRRVERKR